MITPDHIFAESLERLQKGESPLAIAASHPDHQQELEGLLSVAEMGMGIPKLTPPTPYKAYRFADSVAATHGFTEWFSYMRVAIIPISLVVVLLGGRGIVSATENSLPGDKLYSLKRATENAQLSLTKDQDKVASLHVSLMQKRINEVKQAADTGDDTSETLAIAELKSQTEKTFAEAGPIATANAISNQDSTLLDNLVAINKQQKEVLAELSENSDSDSAKVIATTALEDTKKTDMTLARIVATVNDQALMDMPNKVSVTGSITYHYGTKITVERNIFTVDDDTTITGIDGQPIEDTKILTGRATIIGTRIDNGTLVAKQIILLAAEEVIEPEGTVKGDVYPTPTPKPVTPPVEPTPIQPSTPASPTKATGSYITEPSAQQYAP